VKSIELEINLDKFSLIVLENQPAKQIYREVLYLELVRKRPESEDLLYLGFKNGESKIRINENEKVEIGIYNSNIKIKRNGEEILNIQVDENYKPCKLEMERRNNRYFVRKYSASENYVLVFYSNAYDHNLD